MGLLVEIAEGSFEFTVEVSDVVALMGLKDAVEAEEAVLLAGVLEA